MITTNNQQGKDVSSSTANNQDDKLIKETSPNLSKKAIPLPPQNLDFKKRSVTGKLIATILSLILLIAGIAAGVLLIRQEQEIREKAAGFDTCIKSPLCEIIDEPEDSGVHEARTNIAYVIITEKSTRKFIPGVSDDGCYQVTISQNVVMWNRFGTGPTCPEIINIQIWLEAN